MRKAKKTKFVKGYTLKMSSGTITVEDICADGDIWCSWDAWTPGKKEYGALSLETLNTFAKWWTQQRYDENNFSGGLNYDPDTA